jgi:hypothetical protein
MAIVRPYVGAVGENILLVLVSVWWNIRTGFIGYFPYQGHEICPLSCGFRVPRVGGRFHPSLIF